MVNLHRWLKKTSPHLVIAGALIITGLSGCRSAQFTALEVESAPTPYPAPLLVPDAVAKTAPYAEPNTAPSTEDVTKELVLEPPTPPLADSGSNSETGPSQALPLPEIEYPKTETSKKSPINALTQAKPQLKSSSKETTTTDAASGPFDPSDLFHEDNPKSADTPTTGTTDETDVVVHKPAVEKGTSSPVKEKIEDPFDIKFESIVANPEVPVPKPGKNTVSVTKPDSKRAPVTPLKTKPTVESDATDSPITDLFPPPKTKLSLPKVDPANALNEPSAKIDDGENELPRTIPKDEVDTKPLEAGVDEAAFLPVITPATVAKKTKPSIDLALPQSEAVRSAKPDLTTSLDKPEQDQLASIAKLNETISASDPVKSKPASELLTPEASPQPTKLSVLQDAVSVDAEVWSPADNVVFDNSGNAFVSHGKHISKISSDGAVEPWATMGSPRGHVILPDGSHMVADAGQRAIVKLNESGKQVRKVATRSDGYFLRAPNDLVADSKGGVYFTDPGYARIRNPIGRIYYVAADESVIVVAQRLAFPEGIALSSDGSKLFVVESQTRQVVEFEIRSPGTVGPKHIFAELQSDFDDAEHGFANGLLIEPKTGRVFVALGDGYRVEMLSPDGKLLRSFDVGATVNGIAIKSSDTGRLFATGGARSGNKNAGQLFEIRIDD